MTIGLWASSSQVSKARIAFFFKVIQIKKRPKTKRISRFAGYDTELLIGKARDETFLAYLLWLALAGREMG